MDYKSRLKSLQAMLITIPCEALLVEDKINLYYLTGLDLSAGKLLIHSQGAHLFVDSRYFEMCKQKSPFPVRQIDSSNFESQLSDPEFAFIETFAFDSETTSFSSYQQLVKLTERVSSNRGGKKIALIPVDGLIKRLRTIKDANEIQILREAAKLGSSGFDFVCGILREGISEQEVATELEIFWKRLGSKGLAFDPIIAFGTNSSRPHHRAGPSVLQKGDIVLIDIGVNFQHYHSDMTRIAFFGSPDPRLLSIHNIVSQAQQAALKVCRPDITIGTLDSAARDFIASQGFGENFTHSLGHGVGLEIHELPTIKNAPPYYGIPLQSGMVITIEPGIYLPGIGGVRIEDTIVITEDGYENLTQRPTEPILI